MRTLSIRRAEALFRGYLKAAGYKPGTVRTKLQYLKVFFAYLESRGRSRDLREVGRRDLEGFLSHLNEAARARTGRPYAPLSRQGIWASVRLLFRCLYLQQRLLLNPAREIRFRPLESTPPKAILTQAQMARLLDGIDIHAPLGLRDRALFELMYSSGLRVGEAARLSLEELDLKARMLLVRQGKFGKDRLVPLGKVAAGFLRLYLQERGSRPGELFLGPQGRLSGAAINRRFKKRLKQASLYRSGLTAHSIRHCLATHLLEAGAELRYVQELLGHESIETTVAYTNALHESMKRIYKSYHPRENQLWQEVDDEYRKRIEEFRSELQRQAQITARKREALHLWYEKHKRRG